MTLVMCVVVSHNLSDMITVAPMIRAETSNEGPRLFNSESKCKTNTLAKRTGNQGNNRDMRTMV